MTEFNRVNGHYTPFSQVTFPVLIRVFVVYPVFYIVWQEIFEFQRCTKLEVNSGIFPEKCIKTQSLKLFYTYEPRYFTRIGLNPGLKSESSLFRVTVQTFHNKTFL